MKSHIIKTLTTAVLLSSFTGVVRADIVIVVNNSVNLSDITADMAANIFLGKIGELPGGVRLVPVDQENSQKAHTEFYSKVVKKDAAQLNAYWSRLVFTGKGEPPKKMADNADVMALVAANPNIIGYVDASAVNSTVKILLKVQ